jgi:hypothetical protein
LYEVSNTGKVRSLDRVITYSNGGVRTTPGKVIAQVVGKNGYRVVRLYKNQVETKYTTHRLVAKVFIDNPDKKHYVNHIDGNKTNNRADNLEWVTASENGLHAYAIGLSNPQYKLQDEDLFAINVLLKKKVKDTLIARIFGVTPQTIFAIKNGKNIKRYKEPVLDIGSSNSI